MFILKGFFPVSGGSLRGRSDPSFARTANSPYCIPFPLPGALASDPHVRGDGPCRKPPTFGGYLACVSRFSEPGNGVAYRSAVLLYRIWDALTYHQCTCVIVTQSAGPTRRRHCRPVVHHPRGVGTRMHQTFAGTIPLSRIPQFDPDRTFLKRDSIGASLHRELRHWVIGTDTRYLRWLLDLQEGFWRERGGRR